MRVTYISRQSTTHITEPREVLYLWHPWYGRSVWIYQTLTKNGAAICHCGLSQTRDSRALEVPQWMFDSAACSRTQIAPSGAVSGAALLELKELLSRVRPGKSAVVLDAEHRSLLYAGGADAVCDELTTSGPTPAVSPTLQGPSLGGAAARDKTADGASFSATSARARQDRAKIAQMRPDEVLKGQVLESVSKVMKHERSDTRAT